MPETLWLVLLGLMLLGGILSGAPVMLVISGVPLLLALIGAGVGAFDLAFIQAFPQRVFGVMTNTLLIAVPLFVLMGVLLEQSRIAERMLTNFAQLLGGSRGTLALSVLFVSTLIAASTGIIGATIVMLGLISLPSLLAAGVARQTSAGLICAAGTLGQIIPPSIVLILLGDQLSNAYIEAQREAGNFAPDPVTVGDLFAGALLPGLVLVGFYAVYAVTAIRLSPAPTAETGLKSEPQIEPRPSIGALLGPTLPPVLLIVAVLGSILSGVATPTEAAVVGVAGTLLMSAAFQEGAPRWVGLAMAATGAAAFGLVALRALGASRVVWGEGLATGPAGLATLALTALLIGGLCLAALRLMRAGLLLGAFSRTIEVSAMVFGIIIAASMLALVFRGFGGDEAVHGLLTGLPGGAWGMLAVTMLVVFLLGFIMEFVEIVFIVIPIVGPILLQAPQIDPVWFGILIALNLQTSFLTPPFGFALFYFRSVAPDEITTLDIYRAVLPFVLIQIVTIGCVVAFPALATWLPDVLFG